MLFDWFDLYPYLDSKKKKKIKENTKVVYVINIKYVNFAVT